MTRIVAAMALSPRHRPPVTGAQCLAIGGIVSAAITAAGGLANAPRAIGVAGAVMLAANLAALLVERRR